MNTQLRPLSLGETLDVSIKLYRSQFKTLIQAVFVVIFPLQVLRVLILASSRSDTNKLVTTNSITGQTTFHAAALGTVLAANFTVLAVSFVAGVLATAACFRALSVAYLGESTDWRSSLRFAVSKLGPLLWVTFIQGLLLLLGLAACVIPGVYFWGCWVVAIPVLLFEDQHGFKALSRSRALVQGRWWMTAVTYVLGSVLVSILTTAFVAIITGISFASNGTTSLASDIVQVVANTIASSLTTPFIAAVITVIYFDLRVRKEGFDLELLARHVGVDPSDADASPSFPLIPPPPAQPPASDRPGSQPPFWPPPPGWRPEPDE
jgi:hypothetical protein